MSQDKTDGIQSILTTSINPTQKLATVDGVSAVNQVDLQSEVTEVAQVQATQVAQNTQGVAEVQEVEFFNQISEIAQEQQLSTQEIYEKTALAVLQKELSLSPELLAQIAPQIGELIANDPFLSQAVLNLMRK